MYKYELKVSYRDENEIKVNIFKDNQILEYAVLDNIYEVEYWLKEWFPIATLTPITDKAMTVDQRWFLIEPHTH